MSMDPTQLSWMQDAGMGLGAGGFFAPHPAGGAGYLSQLAQGYTSPIQGHALPDTSPLAQLNLQQYGLPGMVAGMAGNAYMSNRMQQQGLLPMGNAGSYMQAHRTREHLRMKNEVSSGVAKQDEEGIYQSFRGAAALAGIPFNREQRDAARSMSETVASFGPALAMLAPDLMDAMSGEKGSVQAMAGQMMDANRYRADPITGKMGYSTESNKNLVNNVFDNLFSKDNMAQMNGMRAGDMGQAYRQLSAEGLVGPTGSLRDRTIQSLQQAREGGMDLSKIDGDIKENTNLATLPNDVLAKLRKDPGVAAKMSKDDASQISDQLQSYVGSLSAIREVFGENGDANAPMPKLINALKAMTSGQMQKFDPGQLKAMVRDMQSMSQLSGKSIDQLVAMNQYANTQNSQVMGNYGVHFNPASTKVGVTTGMAFAEHGGTTGFGALNREQAEQASMGMFSRGMGSQMSNALGALTRIEEAGGFAQNGAGNEMRAALAAADSGAHTYTFVDDKGASQTRNTPTKESQFRTMVGQGAVTGMGASDFNMMLGDRTSNLRALSTNEDRQQAAMRQQPAEMARLISRNTGNRLASSEVLKQIADPKQRALVAAELGKAATAATDDLTMEQLQDPAQRNQAIAERIQLEGRNHGLDIKDEQAKLMAVTSFGQRESTLQSRIGMDATSYAQVHGKAVRASRDDKQSEVKARSGLNEAMSGLGPKGSLLQRFSTSVQKQGDKGEDANLDTLMGDMFAGDIDEAKDRLNKPLEAVRDSKEKIDNLMSRLEGATPEGKKNINIDIAAETVLLKKHVTAAREASDMLGMTDKEGVFNQADVKRGREAGRELDHFNRMDQVRISGSTANVTAADRAEAKTTKLTDDDLYVMAEKDRSKKLEEADKQSEQYWLPAGAKEVYNKAIANGATAEVAKKAAKDHLRSNVISVEDRARELRTTLGADATVNSIQDKNTQDAIIQGRRGSEDTRPTVKAVDTRTEEMRKAEGGQEKKTKDEVDKLTTEDRKTYNTKERQLKQKAEDQLIAENQLRSLGILKADESLNAKGKDIANYTGLSGDKTSLRKELVAAKAEDRAAIVNKYLDSQQVQQFYGTAAEVAKKRDAANAYAASDAGKQAAKKTESSLDSLSEVRREFLSDSKAVSRGGARGVIAAKQSQEAEEELQTLANKYHGGDVGKMVSSGGTALDKKGEAELKKDFGKLSAEEKTKITERLAASGNALGSYFAGFGTANLTEQNYAAYVSLQAKDAVAKMKESVDGMSGGASQTYADLLKPTSATKAAAKEMFGGKANEGQEKGLQALSSAAALKNTDLKKLFSTPADQAQLKEITKQIALGEKGNVNTSNLTKDQEAVVKAAQDMGSLTGLNKDQIKSLDVLAKSNAKDDSKEAAALGMTQEEYKAAVQGEAIDPKLKLFKDDSSKGTAKEQLQKARQDESALATNKTKLASAQAVLARNKSSEGAQRDVARLEELVAKQTGSKDERIKAAGLDPTKKEDVQKYEKLLVNQGGVAQLEKRKAEYTAERKKLADAGMSEADINKKLGTMTDLEKDSQKIAKDLKDKDLGSDAMNTLADSFGKTSVDERKKFKDDMGKGGGATDKNRQMVANVLKDVGKLKGITGAADGDSAIKKLDMLTDEYEAAKTPEAKKKLAEKYKMKGEELDSIMNKTEFLKMKDNKKDYTEKNMHDAMSKVGGKDIAAEVKKEAERTMKLTGTLLLKGAVNGEGNLHNGTAVGGSS